MDKYYKVHLYFLFKYEPIHGPALASVTHSRGLIFRQINHVNFIFMCLLNRGFVQRVILTSVSSFRCCNLPLRHCPLLLCFNITAVFHDGFSSSDYLTCPSRGLRQRKCASLLKSFNNCSALYVSELCFAQGGVVGVNIWCPPSYPWAGLKLMDGPWCLYVSVLFIKLTWESERKRRSHPCCFSFLGIFFCFNILCQNNQFLTDPSYR